ncbi:sensor histidine kinase [Allomuricauda sp. SCSIO 65647]|uniref:sensor histidine kinase n=1 Tax=Allomuricauda sp. SCSIO 65647 TaxID=2908843 RepID=UPI001F2EF46B|nr:histidine kinase [Muricauda sp. SCSIO 65647]UJH66376.1 histidine kinase [Muricauda sp. SCSIO 65647]
MSISKKELVFQSVLLVLVFLFYSFDSEDPRFQWHKVAFFLTYAMAAAIIGYWLMPRFLYHKKYWSFFGYVVVVVTVVILLEELVLEQIFFPGTRRAKGFPGVFYSLLDVLPMITILSGFKFGWDALQKQEQIDALKSAVQESELQFLRSQINPHFLFNNLNNLYAHALEGSVKTPEIILELSGLLRYMLYECKEKFVSLEKEIEQLHNFIKLNKLQIENRGTVVFDTQGIENGYRIAPLILIVFIENAFKHSQAGQTENIEITIHAQMKENVLLFNCANNHEPAQGLDTVAAGIGLRNVQKRLQLLYPDKHSLQIKEDQSRYEVSLSIALEKMNGS